MNRQVKTIAYMLIGFGAALTFAGFFGTIAVLCAFSWLRIIAAVFALGAGVSMILTGCSAAEADE